MPDDASTVNHSVEEEDFAQLFEAYADQMTPDLRVGEKVEAPIIAIGEEAVFVDTGCKIDGFVVKGELLDEDGQLPHQVGDRLTLYVVSHTDSGIQLSKALAGSGNLQTLRTAQSEGIPVEGKVTAPCKGGFQVSLMGRRAFCPISQIDQRYVEKPEEYVGQSFRFLILRLEQGGRNIVVSRRELLDREQAKAREAFLAELQPGAVVEGRVTRLTGFGAFIELFPGVEGLVHISELSWSRVKQTEDVLSPDQVVSVKILGIQDREKGRDKRIALSLKQVGGNPWDQVTEMFHAGQTVEGTVTSVTRYGAFMEIAPGIEGLVHISEMSYRKRVAKPEEIVRRGDTAQAVIKEIDTDKRRISLSIKDAEGDPWADVSTRYSLGQTVEGILEKRESFGLFVALEPGITGLLPASKMRAAEQPDAYDRLKPGDTVAVIIGEIDPAGRRITLLPRSEAGEGGWQGFSATTDAGFGSLGEKLQRALLGKEDG